MEIGAEGAGAAPPTLPGEELPAGAGVEAGATAVPPVEAASAPSAGGTQQIIDIAAAATADLHTRPRKSHLSSSAGGVS
ncbi:MAG TPA: hypothetical protein VKG38_18755 [Solirubrobacteraceae bacterium]|nr:hypothetical protein [Solirubrobacteraceae bacterium]